MSNPFTVRDLAEASQKYIDKVYKGKCEDIVVVRTQGMSGSCVKVTGLCVGFDWYNGRCILRTEVPLSTVDINVHSFYQTEYLYSNSNLKKIEQKLTAVARFKKEEKACKDFYEARMWIYEKLKEEQKKMFPNK